MRISSSNLCRLAKALFAISMILMGNAAATRSESTPRLDSLVQYLQSSDHLGIDSAQASLLASVLPRPVADELLSRAPQTIDVFAESLTLPSILDSTSPGGATYQFCVFSNRGGSFRAITRHTNSEVTLAWKQYVSEFEIPQPKLWSTILGFEVDSSVTIGMMWLSGVNGFKGYEYLLWTGSRMHALGNAGGLGLEESDLNGDGIVELVVYDSPIESRHPPYTEIVHKFDPSTGRYAPVVDRQRRYGESRFAKLVSGRTEIDFALADQIARIVPQYIIDSIGNLPIGATRFRLMPKTLVLSEPSAAEDTVVCLMTSFPEGPLALGTFVGQTGSWQCMWDTVMNIGGIGSAAIRQTSVGIKGNHIPLILISGHCGMKSGCFYFFSHDGSRLNTAGLFSGWWFEIVDLDVDGVDELTIVAGDDYEHRVYRFDSLSQSFVRASGEE